jgi:hypothetical protein
MAVRSSRSRSRQPHGTLVKALARACRWQKLLDYGVYSSVTEAAKAEGISKSYISCILRLTLLASRIVGARSSSGERTMRLRWSGRCRRAGRSSVNF